jgi:hypothetical protein
MRFNMKSVSLATATALGVGLAGALLASHAGAQQAPREKIEVTGSNIKRIEVEGPSPSSCSRATRSSGPAPRMRSS